MTRLFVTLLFLIVTPFLAYANPIVDIEDSQSYSLNNQVDYLLDDSMEMTIDEVKDSTAWQGISRNTINFGFIPQAVWLKFDVRAINSNDYMLHIPYPLLDYLDNYSFVDGMPLPVYRTGDARVYSTRATDHIDFVFPYSLKENQVLTVYLRVDSQGTVDVPLRFLSKETYLSENKDSLLFRGFVMGVLWLMLFYNLFIFISIRDSVYGYYVLNIFAFLVTSNAYDGGAFQLLWPNYPALNAYVFPIFNGLNQVTSIIFMLALLQVMKTNTWYKKYFLGLLAIVSTFPILGGILPYSTIVPIEVAFSLVVYTSAWMLGLHLSIKGNKTAIYFTVAMSLFMTGLVSSNLKGLGLLPTNFFTQHAFQLGFFIDMVVLSLALAQKIEIARMERLQAQKENIKNLKRYQDLYSESLSGNFQVSLSGGLTSVNDAVLNILGYDNQQELLNDGKTTNVNRFSVDESSTEKLLAALMTVGHVVDFEQVARRKDGKLIWVSISVRSVKNDEGITEYYEGSMLDINERKENETLREQAMKEQMATLEQLVVGISHELNTPLGTSITGVSHLKHLVSEMRYQKSNQKLDDELFEVLVNQEIETIDLTGNNLIRVSELIKQFKHISVSQHGYILEESNLLATVSSAIAVFENKMDEAGVKINIICDSKIYVSTYGEAIGEIIAQLVSNSLDHAFESETNKKIDLVFQQQDDLIECIYKDNGSGLTDKGQQELFNPFYTTMRGYQGKVGLGMYLTFNLLTQLLEGNISVEKPEQGVFIKMTFPAQLHSSRTRV